MRDSDQQRCYDAEGFAFSDTIYEANQGLWTIEQCAKEMARSEYWSKARGGEVVVKEARVDATRSSATKSSQTIRIAHGQDTVATLWHELAHLVSDDGHGPNFRGREVECARLGGGDAAAERLTQSFERAGLTWTQYKHWDSDSVGGMCVNLLAPANNSRHARRVAALLNKAASTTAEEAEALMTKALELSNKHGVNAAALAALNKDEEKLSKKVVRIGRGPYVSVRTNLLNAVARGNWCRLVWETDRDGRMIDVIGHENDVIRTLMVFGGLDFEAQRIVLGLKPVGNTVKFRRSWLSGFANGVDSTLTRSTREQTHRVDGENEQGSTALVLARREKRVAEYEKQLWGRVRRVTNRTRTAHGAFSAGHAEGVARASGKEALVQGQAALGR